MNDPSRDTGAWSHNKLQELQGMLEEYVSDNPKSKKADGINRERFRITIDFLVSDNRRRDPDGAINTILDCLVRSVRRLSEGDSGDCGASKKSSKRKRRSNNKTRKHK